MVGPLNAVVGPVQLTTRSALSVSIPAGAAQPHVDLDRLRRGPRLRERPREDLEAPLRAQRRKARVDLGAEYGGDARPSRP